MSLSGQVAIITGGSAGIGRAIAARLAQEGASLMLAARSASRLEEAAAELRAAGATVQTVAADVSDPGDLTQLVDATLSEFGQIDVLVNNAGIDCYHHFHTLEMEDILGTIETNLTGTILLTRLVIPHMLERSSGHIINVASTAGKHCPGFASVYGATKAGQIAFTQGLRGEYGDRGISASAICPGFTRSGGIYDRMVQATGKTTSSLLGSTTTDAVAAAVVKAIRTGTPELIVNWPPVRPAMVIKEIFPRLGEKLAMMASRKFARRVADAHEADAHEADAQDADVQQANAPELKKPAEQPSDGQ